MLKSLEDQNKLFLKLFVIAIQLYKFEKNPVPEDLSEKMKMVENLMKFGVSLAQYEKAYEMDDVTM